MVILYLNESIFYINTSFWQSTFYDNESKIMEKKKLLWACANGKIELVTNILLNTSNIDVNCTVDTTKFTPLQYACKGGYEQIVELLLSKNADPDKNAIGKNSMYKYMAPILYACYNGNLKITEMLLLKGADINTVDNYNATALHYACASGNVKLVELLLKYQANTTTKASTFYFLIKGKMYNFRYVSPINVAIDTAKLTSQDKYSAIIEILSSEERIREFKLSFYSDLLTSRLSNYVINNSKLFSIESILLLRRELKL